MPKVEIHAGGGKKVLTVSEKTPLSVITAPYGLPMPCGGNHTCGKCRVRAIGQLSPLSEEEKRLLTPQELADGLRLACSAEITGDCTVFLPESGGAEQVLLSGTFQGAEASGWGLAVDIGTTTLAAYACRDGEVVASAGQRNCQSPYGADVITRIGANQPELLHQLITKQVSELCQKVLGDAAAPKDVCRIVVTGNTTMLHFFRGYDPAPIAAAPFTPHSLFGETLPASQLLPAYENAELYLPPCISAYVGADMVCAILSSRMGEKEETALLADIGTNGEMALWHKGELYACSTAAGPALEGACIHMGMEAAPGAIDRVTPGADGELCWHTIGEVPAKGLCGSGLISLINCLLQTGRMDETGALCDPEEAPDGSGEDCVLVGDSGVFLTQKDIRQVQLAKAAICAGIHTMLDACRLSPEQVDTFYLCGGFGSYLEPESAAGIGLFPASLKDKVRVLGNAAGSGAAMLLSDKYRKTARKLCDQANLIELSASPVFMEEYVEQMSFETE